jgi:hypothetical protein
VLSDPNPNRNFRRFKLRSCFQQTDSFLEGLGARGLSHGLVELAGEPSRKSFTSEHPRFAVVGNRNMTIRFAIGRAKEINLFAEFDQLPRLARGSGSFVGAGSL